MKIRWKKVTATVADGYIGRVRCFVLAQQGTVYILTCELPSDDDRLYGRRETSHSSAKRAVTQAAKSFKTWWRALHAET